MKMAWIGLIAASLLLSGCCMLHMAGMMGKDHSAHDKPAGAQPADEKKTHQHPADPAGPQSQAKSCSSAE